MLNLHTLHSLMYLLHFSKGFLDYYTIASFREYLYSEQTDTFSKIFSVVAVIFRFLRIQLPLSVHVGDRSNLFLHAHPALR